MNSLLNAASTPTRTKRLNKIPMMLGFGLIICISLAFIYMIYLSSARQQRKNAESANAGAYAADDSAAKSFLDGKQQFGAIGADNKPQVNPTLNQNFNKAAATPPATPPKPELTQAEKDRERIRAQKQKQFEMAVTASSAVGSGGALSAGGLPAAHGNLKITTPAANPFAALQDLQKLKENLNPKAPPDTGDQAHKNDFLEKQAITEYLPHTRAKQQSPLEVKTGTVIPATMLTGLNSDLPGMILAQVSQNVYDTATGGYLLIPQGSRLVGSYDSYITYGQSRALVSWTRVIFPDGSTIELKGMPGTDQGGFAGLEDQVDNHYARIFGSAILMSVINGAFEYSQGSNSSSDKETVGESMSNAVGRELTSTSAGLLRKNLNIQPTIKIRQGYKLNVMVNRDIIFPDIWLGANS